MLDDCLGQYYFKMKETQGNELLSLVKYVACYKNKKLIMNSRVTIFQQAKERIVEFYQDILKEFRYKEIVKHNNYTPRIMEFVTREYNFKKVSSDNYYKYVCQCLDNPTEIWQDEFSEKLQQEDRILLTTLYLLTDTSIDENILKRAFNYRLCNNTIVDTSKNIWEDVLNRLEGAFLQIIVRSDVERYIESYLEPSELEYDHHERDYDYGIAGEMDVLDCIFK